MTPPTAPSDLSDITQGQLEKLLTGSCRDPFSLLGRHKAGRSDVIRVFMPDAREVRLVRWTRTGIQREQAMRCVAQAGLYEARIPANALYKLRIGWADGWEECADPYSFGPLLSAHDLHLFGEGKHRDLASMMGAQVTTVDDIPGVRFAVWAPNAGSVSVVGDFNLWNTRRHPMRFRHDAGIWELFIPGIGPGSRYKYDMTGPDGRRLPLHADPFALASEVPPATASVIADPAPFKWNDQQWIEQRARRHTENAPLSIYECHVGSWRRPGGDGTQVLTWDELKDTLIPYVADLGFTHIELMPVMSHPFDGSWGYQPLGLFAPMARQGSPRQLASFIDACHQAGLGVILDWVPAHFPSDLHGLACFDGTCLFEHMDPKEGLHPDWDTLIYNVGRNEVRGFLIASALMWLNRYHIDGLRVDAVASMLYRDYSRPGDDWVPNQYGGRENLEAVGFLRELNDAVKTYAPHSLMIAEESTAWPGVTHKTQNGGLGFDYKWNMGWMHDTLSYVGRDPIWRRYHHDNILFGLHYAFSEKFILPLSHDEVVHGKGSLLSRMPGEGGTRYAGLRAYLAFMWAHPGKKLIFMGAELAQWEEWNPHGELAWPMLDTQWGRGMHTLVRDLNRLHRELPAMHQRDTRPDGFIWVIGNDTENSVFAWFRYGDDDTPVLVICNMTPVARSDYRIGVPQDGWWAEYLNTDAHDYGGGGEGNAGGCMTQPVSSHGYDQSCILHLPPLSVIYLKPTGYKP
ncbi:1,4-alpha-glucan branching protein GlgB [Acetobacter indonesiensis]|uniref:1,4-alpha-glucan branching protein GlgB n=1 Tax=Acetobacter indonesiensis TaxID=104101 RepID=UPI001F02D897|nr:1,4-alpha-glucan branching protein GlgB [Acetobacter indonesiensis]MCG0995824.1 1,4-alpha-glucan branching protein GlgB [Acetobacter indonesiensis]